MIAYLYCLMLALTGQLHDYIERMERTVDETHRMLRLAEKRYQESLEMLHLARTIAEAEIEAYTHERLAEKS